MDTRTSPALGRRALLGAGLALPALAAGAMEAAARTTPTEAVLNPGRRRLAGLEVSSIGLGVQNMTRTYQTTIPTRPEMIRIIRAAHEVGVTFFDAAEAYGAHEVERLLGEAVAPIRDSVQVTSKFGAWTARAG